MLFACIKDVQMNLLQSLDRQCLSLLVSFLQIDNQLRFTPYPVLLSFDGGYRSGQVDNLKSRDDVTRTKIENLSQMSSSSVPVLCLEISKWRKKDTSFISYEYVKLRFLFSNFVASLQITVTALIFLLIMYFEVNSYILFLQD